MPPAWLHRATDPWPKRQLHCRLWLCWLAVRVYVRFAPFAPAGWGRYGRGRSRGFRGHDQVTIGRRERRHTCTQSQSFLPFRKEARYYGDGGALYLKATFSPGILSVAPFYSTFTFLLSLCCDRCLVYTKILFSAHQAKKKGIQVEVTYQRLMKIGEVLAAFEFPTIFPFYGKWGNGHLKGLNRLILHLVN